MYNIDLITDKIKTLVGFMNEPDITLDPLEVNIVTSVGKAINKRHPLAKLRILDKVRPKEQDLGDYLNELLDRSVYDVLTKVSTSKIISETTKGVLGSVQSLYRMSDVNGIPQQVMPDFIGYRLAPIGSDYLTIRLDRVALALLNPQTINLYIYHSSNLSEPFKTIPLEITKSGGPTWVSLTGNDLLDFFDKNLDRGGYYYIGIKRDELESGNMVMSREYDWEKAICGSCNMWDKTYYDSWSKYSRFSPITASANGTEISDVERVNKTTHGINLNYTVSCDITQFILDNINVIQEAVILQTICIVLQEIISGVEVNRIANVTKDEAYIELNGEFSSNGRERIKDGFIVSRDKQLEAFSIDISKICNVCMPKDRPNKLLKWRG